MWFVSVHPPPSSLVFSHSLLCNFRPRRSLPLSLLFVLFNGLSARATCSSSSAAKTSPSRQAAKGTCYPESQVYTLSWAPLLLEHQGRCELAQRWRKDEKIAIVPWLCRNYTDAMNQIIISSLDFVYHCWSIPGRHSRTPSASSSVFEGTEVHVGERVLVVGQRTGVVQFYGNTSFAPGQLSKWTLPNLYVWNKLYF